MTIHRFSMIALLAASTFVLTACGRDGAPLRPAPGVIIMDEESPSSNEPVEDKPFILDRLL